jgi:hypothetical protein
MGPGGDIDQQVSWSSAMNIILERPGTQGALEAHPDGLSEQKERSPSRRSRGECGDTRSSLKRVVMCTILKRIKDNALGQSPKDKSVDLGDLGLTSQAP